MKRGRGRKKILRFWKEKTKVITTQKNWKIIKKNRENKTTRKLSRKKKKIRRFILKSNLKIPILLKSLLINSQK